jgi:hypothetical protein
MISLTVTGHPEPEQDRAEIARLLKEYGPGAVCLLRDGSIYTAAQEALGDAPDLGDNFECLHMNDGTYPAIGGHENDMIRVFPPGTCLRVTVEVVE